MPSALAFLMHDEPDIVKNFLLKTLQGWEKTIDRFKLGERAMPASFKVLHDPERKTDSIVADFGESAIYWKSCSCRLGFLVDYTASCVYEVYWRSDIGGFS